MAKGEGKEARTWAARVGKNIAILRTVDGRTERFKFNYKDVAAGKNLEQNILLRPGDTVVVP